jgi:serine/threonine-protein kinase
VVARRDVESSSPKGIVVQMDPAANALVAPGSTITLFVSKGPTEATVPDVTSFSRADAIATLRNSGFKALVEVQDTDDPSLDGVVMTQSPGPGESAKPGATVTITVGHFVEPPPETTTTATTTTATATTAATTTEEITTQPTTGELPPPTTPTVPAPTTTAPSP